ncbi:PepSY-associated TM helix domain-containing protein [Nitritalea halalkaliphila]|uniref:PepSY-associated TM helix domain-containing protein n=1 Tax=Nitritalea halalkaliphila TaxID=590849 RepID=UPI001EE68A0E|nr:PepSY-associated TM helix domain-containing protein [Nitritalea halalkaliphila]
MPSSLSAQTRFYRKLHKWLSLPLLFFMVLVSVTGILLAWKKPLALLPPTQRTQVERPEQMLPVEELMRIGVQYVQDSVGLNPLLDRVDIRPEKGIAKIVFKRHFKEVQLDAYSGRFFR